MADGEEDANAKKVIVAKDGPYIVEGSVPLSRETIINDEEGIPAEWGIQDRLPGGRFINYAGAAALLSSLFATTATSETGSTGRRRPASTGPTSAISCTRARDLFSRTMPTCAQARSSATALRGLGS